MCPADLHAEFMGIADRTGEGASVILRALVADAVARARRGEPVALRLAPAAPTPSMGG